MFWGLILEPQRRYSQMVKRPFRITMAALDVNSSNEDPTQVMVTFQDRNFLMCTLQKGKILNERLDLCFEEGAQISFAANGSSHVHLTGYLMDTEEGLSEGEEEFEEESEKSPESKKRSNEDKVLPPTKKSKTLELLENVNSDSEDDSDFNLSNSVLPDSSDDEDSEDGEEEEVDEEEEDEDNENEEVEEEEEEGEDEDTDEEYEEENEEEEEVIKPEIKVTRKQQQNAKQQQQKDAKKTNSVTEVTKSDKKIKPEKQKSQENAFPQKNGTPPKKKIIEGGVGIEELKIGNGPVAKPGKFVQVYYEGRLKANNKLFDSATKGSGFEFRLGRQEVIKGWDIGVAGMKVGGKRRVTCPPNAAYGAKGSPPAIPPNSTLIFDIELKKVK